MADLLARIREKTASARGELAASLFEKYTSQIEVAAGLGQYELQIKSSYADSRDHTPELLALFRSAGFAVRGDPYGMFNVSWWTQTTSYDPSSFGDKS